MTLGCIINFKINLGNEEIKEVKDLKFLGIILDPHLKFDKHVKKISKTANLS